MDTKGHNIILGSGSPRRKELISELGFNFEVDTRNTFEEVYSEDTPQEMIPQVLSEGKSPSWGSQLMDPHGQVRTKISALSFPINIW